MRFITTAVIGIILTLSPVYANQPLRAEDKLTIGLALGSGGAGGLAHIAMLQVFDDLKVKPGRIVGTSIGAVIGALYAAGLSADEIYAIFAEFEGSKLEAFSELVQFNEGLSFEKVLMVDVGDRGLIDPKGFLEFLAGKIEARSFSDLKIPLEIVATDYWTGEEIILKKGNLLTAIQASMAVPGLFPPVPVEEKLLIDGGTSNPLPFDLLGKNIDLKVAIDVTGSRDQRVQKKDDWLEIFFSTFEIMQQSMIAIRMKIKPPDIYIKPAIKNVRLLHFNRIKEVMRQAQPSAEQLREKLRPLLVE